jgi:hypothetical protein
MQNVTANYTKSSKLLVRSLTGDLQAQSHNKNSYKSETSQ